MQSVLERNALLVAALNGHAHRRGDPASPQAQALREELKANLVHLMRANQPGFAEEQRRPFERGERTSSGEVLSFLPPLPPPAPPAPPPPPEMPLLQLRPKLQPGACPVPPPSLCAASDSSRARRGCAPALPAGPASSRLDGRGAA